MRKASHLLVYAPLVALIDLLLIHLGFVLAFDSMNWRTFARAHYSGYIHMLPYLCAGSLAILYACNLYVGWMRQKTKNTLFSVMVATAAIVLLTAGICYWEHSYLFPRSVMAAAGAFQFVFLAMYRVCLQKWFLCEIGQRKAYLVAPDRDTAMETLTKLQECAPEWMQISGYLLSDELDELELRADEFDTVLIAPNLASETQLIKWCARMRKHAMVIPAVLELCLLGARPVEVGDVLMLSIQPPHFTPGVRFVKRVFDLLTSALMLVLTAPIWIAAAVAIRLTSRGPVIFKQERVGRDGKEYTIYKFRTMVADAEKNTGPVLASETDSRITPLGHWLRATRIDELPQLLNVLKGHMSLVGPRPERKYFVEQFREVVPGYELRFGVKPGVTGLAQVAGGYSTTVQRKLRFDLMYIFNHSLLLDLQILLRTIMVVVDRKQAEGVADSIQTTVLVEGDD
jgi:exopolysaccharide biosynthesis polyprenyl glycosylphosphotransferase